MMENKYNLWWFNPDNNQWTILNYSPIEYELALKFLKSNLEETISCKFKASKLKIAKESDLSWQKWS